MSSPPSIYSNTTRVTNHIRVAFPVLRCTESLGEKHFVVGPLRCSTYQAFHENAPSARIVTDRATKRHERPYITITTQLRSLVHLPIIFWSPRQQYDW